MTTPTIHLNGTHPKTLLEDYSKALDATKTAIALLKHRASPNGRDYYPQGTEAIQRAVQEHESRLDRLYSVRDEIIAIITHIMRAAGDRI